MNTGWPKKKIGTIVLYALTLPNVNRFSKLFHYQNEEKICNNTITKDQPHFKCVSTLSCEMSSVLKQQLKTRRLQKQHVLRKSQKEITCLLSQLLSKVIVTSCIFLHQIFNLFALLWDNRLKLATPLTNGAVSETLRQFAPLSGDTLEVWRDL